MRPHLHDRQPQALGRQLRVSHVLPACCTKHKATESPWLLCCPILCTRTTVSNVSQRSNSTYFCASSGGRRTVCSLAVPSSSIASSPSATACCLSSSTSPCSSFFPLPLLCSLCSATTALYSSRSVASNASKCSHNQQACAPAFCESGNPSLENQVLKLS